MSFAFHCPKCDALLNPNVRVVLTARYRDMAGIVLLSTKLGDYQFICDKGFCKAVKTGEMVDFCCPVCSESLTSQTHETFTELVLRNPANPDHHPYLLRFSRISEEHATFLYDGEKVQAFGEAAGLFRQQMIVEGDWGW